MRLSKPLHRQLRTAVRGVWLVLACAAGVFLASCGGGGGGAVQPIVPTFELRVAAVPGQGVQVGRPFAIRVEFVVPGTGESVSVPQSAVITATLLDATTGEPVGGSGASASPVAGGATEITIEGLVVDEVGEIFVRLTSPNAASPIDTNTFSVGPQLGLALSGVPTQYIVGRVFEIAVAVTDVATGEQVAPGFDVEVQVAIEGASETFVGTLQANGADLEIVGALPDLPLASTRFVATAPGFPAFTSDSIDVDRLILQGVQRDGSGIVRGPFSVQGTLVLESSGDPVALTPPAIVQVALADGASAVLTGVTTGVAGADGAFAVGPLAYPADDDIALRVSAAGVASVDLLTAFAFDLNVSTEGSTMALANEPVGPFAARIVDAFGVSATTPAPIEWSVVRLVDSVEVRSGSAPFVDDGAGDFVARVTPEGFTKRGDYRLVIDGGSQPRVAGSGTADFMVEFDTVDAPGPFVALTTARVGSSVDDDGIAFSANPPTGAFAGAAFGLLDGDLPPGLALDPVTGDITGQPATPGAFEFVAFARLSDTQLHPIRCALAAFSVTETELDPPPADFRSLGPFAASVEIVDDTWGFTSSFDGVDYTTASRIWLPPASEGAVPLLAFHRARSVEFADYDGFARHLASWGIAVASVDDFQSFSDGSGRAPNATYDGIVAYAGMESGAAFLEAMVARLGVRAATEGDVLQGRIKAGATFFGGHGWGGGSAQAAHHRFRINNALGYVYLMPVDLRLFPGTEPPGDPQGTPAYPIDSDQPRVPQLIVAAENDGDVPYPIADQLHERRTGPSTMVTIYGGCNSFQTDTGTIDAIQATISRAAQQAETNHFVTAFLKRWADSDRTLDRVLYRNVAPGSDIVAVQTWRNPAERILIDDFVDANPATNLFGGLNVLTAGSRAEQSIYPTVGAGFDTLAIQQSIAFLSSVVDATYSTAFASIDASQARRVVLRIGQMTQVGFDWVTIGVRGIDGAGTSSTVTVWDRLSQTGRLPDHQPGMPNVFDRLVDLEVDFDEFDAALDISDLRRLELVFQTVGDPGFSRQIFVDDLRIE